MSAKDQIKQIVDFFKREPYLRDKTDGMAEGLMLGANLADDANERSKEAAETTLAVQEKYKEQILTQDLNPNKDPELVDIRDGSTTAGERIRKFEQETNRQLEQTPIMVNKPNSVYNEFENRGVNVNWFSSAQEAVNNASIVFFPSGVYSIENLEINKKTTLIGLGDVSIVNETTEATIVHNSGELVIDNIELNATGNSRNILSHGGSLRLLNSSFIADASVDNPNVEASNMEYVELDNNYFSGGTINALIKSPKNLKVSHNLFKNSTKWDNLNFEYCDQFEVYGNESHNSRRSGMTARYCRNGSIYNNNCHNNKKDIYNEGGWGIVLSESCRDISVYSNTCRNNDVGGITIDVFNEDGSIPPRSNCLIYSNTIENDAILNNVYGISNNGSKGNKVYDNIIKNVFYGIGCVETSYNEIHNNTIEGCGNWFIQFVKDEYSVVRNNTFKNLQKRLSATGVAPLMFNNCDFTVAEGNSLSDFMGGNHVAKFTNSRNVLFMSNHIYSKESGSAQVFYSEGGNYLRVISNVFYDSYTGLGESFQLFALASSGTVLNCENNMYTSKTITNKTNLIGGNSIPLKSSNVQLS